MAKKEKAASPKVVTVQDLAKKFDIEPRKVRMIIREAGFRAPAIEQKAGEFGPRSKYEWEEGSKDLAKIEKALEEATNGASEKPAPKKAKAEKEEKPTKGKKAAKAAEPEEDEDEDEEEDEEDEDEDEE